MLQGFHLAPSTRLYSLHHTDLEPVHVVMNLPPVDGVPRQFRARGRTSRGCCCHLLYLLSQLAKLSGDERPEGSQPAFAVGDIARLNRYPADYQRAFASSLVLYPQNHQLPLRFAFPSGVLRAYRVPPLCLSGLGPPCSPTASWSRRGCA